jgi:hypothetical protein
MSDVHVRPAARTRRRVLPVLRLWFAHNSGRFDRPAGLWRHALIWLTGRASLVTGTEAAGRSASQFRDAIGREDWAYAHLTGAAVGECYGVWDPSVLDLFAHPFAHKLTDLTWVRSPEYGGKPAAKVHALVLPLRVTRGGRKHWIAVVHMPLDNTPARAAAWVDCCKGLAALQADLHRRDPEADFIVVMDGNKNLRLHDEAGMVRQHLEKPLHAVTSWEYGLPKGGGTHGVQVIDYALLPKPLLVAAELLKDLPDSDHRAFRYRVRRK